MGVSLGCVMDVNRPDVVAAVTAEFERYERALVAGDLAVLSEQFWASPLTLRYGIADQQVGADAVDEWRAAQPALPPGRALEGTAVTTFGDAAAVVTTRFHYPDRPRVGRQSQTWIRFAEGWRIVSAHVSEIAAGA